MTGSDPEADYYQAVEEFFVSRRGDPLFLSNADWLLIRRWRKQGLPLRVVLRGIADALEGHAHSFSRARKVGSLRYCEAEVDVARERWERALSLGAEPGVDVRASLEGFERALARASGLGPQGAAVAAQVGKELLALDAARPRELEPALMELELRLVAAIEKETDRKAIQEVQERVDGVLERYRARLPARVYADLRRQSLVREMLAAHGIPRLSLFGL